LRARISSDAVLPHARPKRRTFPAIQLESEAAITPWGRAEGYPVSLNKKSCARLATYRQWAERYFEKPRARTKRKDFMKIFLGSAAKYDCGWPVSIRHSDSDPCINNAKAAALFCGREANSLGIRFSSTAVARNIRHAITWIVRSAYGCRFRKELETSGERADRRRYAR
jgi:hypothetical protein